MSSIYDWSVTEANNATADSGINWQEGQLPSTVNNSARYMMRRGKELLNDIGAIATAAGTANVITVTASSPFTAYSKGIRLLFKAASTNTAAATLNVNSVGAKNIVTFEGGTEQAIGPGYIIAGGLFEVVYDSALATGSGAWVLLKPGARTYSTKSSGYTALPGDNGSVVRYTATATEALTAAATLGPSWSRTIIADGGPVTIDPNGSELINGLATLTIPQGGTVGIICDGTGFYTYAKPSAWEPIGSQVTLAGQSSVSWTNLDVYRHLRLTLGYIPSAGTGNVLLRVSTDNGSSYISTSTYSSASLVQTGATVTGAGGAASTAMIVSNTTVDANSGFLSTIDVSNFNKNAPASYKVISEYSNTNPRIDFVYGGHGGTTARNALQLLVTSGSFTAGMVLLEGLRG